MDVLYFFFGEINKNKKCIHSAFVDCVVKQKQTKKFNVSCNVFKMFGRTINVGCMH